MSDKMIKVSVILPVYGVEKYIEKCTESLLRQTLDEMEFIFVDDHGPDNSIEKAKNVIKGHARESQFKFIKPEHNLGAGMARNFAFQYAEGEYVAFVDSDDTIEPTMFEELYNEASKYGKTDLCYCHAFKDYEDGKATEILRNPIVDNGPFTPQNRRYFLRNYVSLFCSFIYKKDLLEKYHISYPEERSADDSYFVSCCLMTAESIAHVDKPFYHYLIRPGSICTTKVSDKYKKRLATFAKLMRFAKENGVYDTYKAEVDYVYMKKGYVSSVLNFLYNSSAPTTPALREIGMELESQIPDYTDNVYYKGDFKLRCLTFLFKNCPWLTTRLMARIVRRLNLVV
ncbi:MAG: glycosyltransferase [Paludibacteraceae bacterium]|nr:glycosyltransferase [Paludibacteraceae bacterium]